MHASGSLMAPAAGLGVSHFADRHAMMHATIDTILDAWTIDVLRASSTATCEILDPHASSPRSVPLTPARELTAEQVSELRKLLLNPQSWFFAKKRCLPARLLPIK
jgi:hypothetical protein